MNRDKTHNESSPLDDLFAKVDSVPDNDLASALRGKILLDSVGEHVYMENSFTGFSVKKRLLAVALGLHALHRKGIVQADGLFRTVEWFANHVQVKPATVAQELSRLKRMNYFERNSDSGYGVPFWAIKQAIAELTEKGG